MLDHSIYPARAIDSVVDVFGEHLVISGFVRTEQASALTVDRRDEAPLETVDEFLAYLLSAALELQLIAIASA